MPSLRGRQGYVQQGRIKRDCLINMQHVYAFCAAKRARNSFLARIFMMYARGSSDFEQKSSFSTPSHVFHTWRVENGDSKQKFQTERRKPQVFYIRTMRVAISPYIQRMSGKQIPLILFCLRLCRNATAPFLFACK